jgi:hypothetical protein
MEGINISIAIFVPIEKPPVIVFGRKKTIMDARRIMKILITTLNIRRGERV